MNTISPLNFYDLVKTKRLKTMEKHENSPVDVTNPIERSTVEMKDRERDRSSSMGMRNDDNNIVVPGFKL